MNSYQITYTIYLEVQAKDSTEALAIAAETDLEDFYLYDIEVDAIPRD